MEFYLLAYVAISLLLVLLIVLNLKKKIPQKENPYTKVDRLFSPSERSFYAVLCQACDNKAIVFGKTSLSGILDAQQRLFEQQKKAVKSNSTKVITTPQKGFKKIAKNNFDYILCDRSNLQVIAVIELDAVTNAAGKISSKDRALQDKRIRRLEVACDAANLQLYQFNATKKYAVTDLEKAIFNQCADRSIEPELEK